MIQCNDCGRHHKQEESRCPFCEKGPWMGTLATKMTLVFTPMMLGACYGVPPTDGYPPVDTDTAAEILDADGDGHGAALGDCDDDNADVNPDAEEICDDGIDNNCDDQVDEEDCIAE